MFIYFWPLFGALFGGLAAQRNGWNVLAGVVGGALLGPLAILLLFAKGSGAEAGSRSAGAQVGRGVLIAVGLVVLVLGALIVVARMGAAR
jgi:hypothetical protein